MLRHCALFRWREDTTDEHVDALREGLRCLPDVVPGIRSYTFGSDLGLREGNFDFCVLAEFDDAESFRAYVEHPAHQELLAELIEPIRAERVSLQFDDGT